jgi:hypothetical protein
MSEASRATPDAVKRMIEELPDNSIPAIFNFVVLECMKRDTFKGKSLAKLAESIEKSVGGK